MKRLFFSSLYVNLFVRFINMITGILGARFLGPYGRGELAAANRWAALFAVLFTFGLPGAVIFLGKTNREKQSEYLGAYLVVGSMVGLVGLAFGEYLIPKLFFHQPHQLVQFAQIAMLSVPFGILSDGLVGSLLTLNQFKKVLLLRIIGEVGTLFLILGLVIFGEYTVGYFIVGNLVWSILNFFLSAYLTFRLIQPKFKAIVLNSKKITTKGFQINAAEMVSMFGNNIDQLVISLFLSPYTLGLYAVSITIGGIMSAVISSALGIYLWPKLMDLPIESRKEKIERIHGVLFYGMLGLSIVAGFVLPFLLPLVYGHKFSSAVLMTEIILMSTPFTIGYIVITYFLSTSNKFNITAASEAVGLAVGILVTLPLIHIMDGIGAAIGVFLATLCKWVFVLIMANRLGLEWSRLMNPYLSAFIDLALLLKQRIIRTRTNHAAP